MKRNTSCAVCDRKAITTRPISINNRPRRKCPVCGIHADAANEDKPKFKVVLYQEIYTTVEVWAEDESSAKAKVLRGEYDETMDVIDVTVKESEIIVANRLS